MQVLLQFLSRAYPLFFFLFLELVCFILMINHHHYQRVTYLHGANAINGFFDDKINGVGEYLYLDEENAALVRQNQQLLNQLYNTNDFNLANEIAIEDTSLCDNNSKELYIVRAAKVINRTVNRQHNYLTIDKGSKDGLREEMGVIAEDGMVGIIKNVSANYATVMTLLHKQSKVSALMKTTNNFGSLQWDGTDTRIAKLHDIPSYVPIPIGDTIITSGFSSIFPEGILIGIIKDKKVSEGNNFHIIDVELVTNFNTLRNVYIIDYKDKEERSLLEQETTKGLLE